MIRIMIWLLVVLVALWATSTTKPSLQPSPPRAGFFASRHRRYGFVC